MFRLRHVPSLHTMLSLIFKTTCVVLLETVVQAYTLKGIIMEIYTTTYNHFCLKSKLNRLYIVSLFMCVYKNLAGHIAFFPLNNADTSRNGTASSASEKRKGPHNGILPFYNPSFIFPSILLFCLQLS